MPGEIGTDGTSGAIGDPGYWVSFIIWLRHIVVKKIYYMRQLWALIIINAYSTYLASLSSILLDATSAKEPAVFILIPNSYICIYIRSHLLLSFFIVQNGKTTRVAMESLENQVPMDVRARVGHQGKREKMQHQVFEEAREHRGTTGKSYRGICVVKLT